MTEFNYNLKPDKRSIWMRKPIYGIGVNDADYRVYQNINSKIVTCPFYRKWVSMLARCYDSKLQKRRPTYIGCSVCDEWHTFTNFREWMQNQDYTGKQLDKDILVFGNKIYSPETCLFVSGEINRLINDHAARRGAYPQGISWSKRDNKYRAMISIYGKNKYLGCFDVTEEAEEEYLVSKVQHIGEIAMQQTGRLKTALICWVNRQISIID